MLDLAAVKAYLGIAALDTSQDAALQLIVDATNQYIEDTTLMNYGADKTRTDNLDYRDNVYLKRMGIKSIQSITLYQSGTETVSAPIAANSYTYNDIGRLTLNQIYGDDYSRADYNSVHVAYTYGLPTGEVVPADLKLAALQLARETYEGTRGSDSRRVKTERTGSYSVEFADTSHVDTVISRYRVPRV